MAGVADRVGFSSHGQGDHASDYVAKIAHLEISSRGDI